MEPFNLAWLTALFLFDVGKSTEYDLYGNVIPDDYNLEYELDDDQYFEMSIGQLLCWTLGSTFIGIIVCGGTVLWAQRAPKWQHPYIEDESVDEDVNTGMKL